MTIDGRPSLGSATFEVIDPSSGATFTSAPTATDVEIDRAVEAASRALAAWGRDEPARRTALRRCAEAVRAEAVELGRLLATELGKPLPAAIEEARIVSLLLDGAAVTEIPVDVFTEASGRVEVRRRPIGVVAAIVPWNFPLALAAWKVAPALLTGNTVVLKPSPLAPIATLRLGEILGAIVPPGVLNVVSGGAPVGERLVTREAVRRVAFTGSQSTGKRVAQLTAGDLKRVSLELGGNDAAIVLADAPPKEIARRLFWGAFANSGQICTAIKRLFVAEEIFEPLVDELVALARQTRVGDPFDPATELGPIGNEMQLERVIDLVADARRAGARVRVGGDRIAGPGFFYPPTIVTDIAEGTRLVDEEQFGPVLPVLSFRAPDEAIARANATHFGLSGSIWTRDPARGAALAAQLECGTSWVNQHMEISAHAPFGGWKWSGLGRENGRWGLESFTELQVVHVRADGGSERGPT